jgi:hypothetical protein
MGKQERECGSEESRHECKANEHGGPDDRLPCDAPLLIRVEHGYSSARRICTDALEDLQLSRHTLPTAKLG